MSPAVFLACHTRASYEWLKVYKRWYTSLPGEIWNVVDSFLTEERSYSPKEPEVHEILARIASGGVSLKPVMAGPFDFDLQRPLTLKYEALVKRQGGTNLEALRTEPLTLFDGYPNLFLGNDARALYPTSPLKFIRRLPYCRRVIVLQQFSHTIDWKPKLFQRAYDKLIEQLETVYDEQVEVMDEEIEDHNQQALEKSIGRKRVKV